MQAAGIQFPPVAVIYTSELRRARETCSAISRENVPSTVEAGLNEISYGEWDGQYWSDIEREYPELAAAKLENWTAITPPGGEEWRDFEDRVNRVLQRMRNGPLPAAVIAHITVNAQIAHLLTGCQVTGFTQRYAEVLPYEI